jgi:thioesterase domain-containing protein
LNEIYLAGWSMGGNVAIGAAKLPGDKVKLLVMVDDLQKVNWIPENTAWSENIRRNLSIYYKNHNFWMDYHRGDTTPVNRVLESMEIYKEMPTAWPVIFSSVFKWVLTDF